MKLLFRPSGKSDLIRFRFQTAKVGIPAAAVLAAVMLFISPAWGAPPQKPLDKKNEPAEVTAPSGKIGDSGYVVPLPEIKMRNIIGNKPPARPPVEEPEKAVEKELPPPQEGPAEPVRPPAQPQSVPQRPERPAEPVQPPEQPPAVQQQPVEVLPQTPVEVTPRIQETPRLPFDPSPRRPQEIEPKPGPVEVPADRDEDTPVFSSPQAPEPMTEAPPPKKEMLKRKAAAPQIPALLDNPPVKSAAKAIPLESIRLGSSAESEGSIVLDSRKEPEVIPEPEPAPRESLPPPERPTVTRPETAPVPPREDVPAPAQVTQPESSKEAVPMEPPTEPTEEFTTPKETVPSFEHPAPPPKESFPSPLDHEALNSREVRDYLRQTAPILEELSLLMTRAPSLNVSDYDPSDPGAPLVPKELFLKMDSMKRDLQILDSKTFAIIPPAKYAKFHAVIRESIASTSQACDAIIAYFQDSSPENLQKVVNSLGKAREFIRRTRTAEG